LRDTIKTFKNLPDSDSERDILDRCSALFDAAGSSSNALRDAKVALDRRTLARYRELTEEQIKSLVINDKWFADLRRALEEEVQRLSQRLADRTQELEERYSETVPTLEQASAELGGRVEAHLRAMGLKW